MRFSVFLVLIPALLASHSTSARPNEPLRLLTDAEISALLPKVSITQATDSGEYFGPDGRYIKWGLAGLAGTYRIANHAICVHLASHANEVCRQVFTDAKGQYYVQVVEAHAKRPQPWFGKFY